MHVEASRPRPIVLIDDEPASLQALSLLVQANGLSQVRLCATQALAQAVVEDEGADCLLLDLTMPEGSGEQFLAWAQREHPEVPVIVVTATADLDTAVRCMRSGASDYILKPVEEARLVASLKRTLALAEMGRVASSLREAVLTGGLSRPEVFAPIITRHPRMLAIFLYVEAVATTSQPVLVTGETGVGKELLARAIHEASGRNGPFVAVNIAGLDDQLFSDTLFGHRRGAFTGADAVRKGLIEQAEGGTLFLDEIGDLSLVSQAKLLRLVQEREYYPLGSDLARRSTARVVCATHRDLEAMVGDGSFRRDLFYRLRAHHLDILPLRERPEDLPPLVEHLLCKAASDLGKPVPTAPAEIFDYLQAYHFPGNVRELEAMLYDAVSRHRGRVLSLDSIKAVIQADSHRFHKMPDKATAADGTVVFGAVLPSLKEVQDLLVAEAIRRSGGNQATAAALLGVTRQALNKRMNKRPELGTNGGEGI